MTNMAAQRQPVSAKKDGYPLIEWVPVHKLERAGTRVPDPFMNGYPGTRLVPVDILNPLHFKEVTR